VIVNTAGKVFDNNGNLSDGNLESQLQLLARQVIEFALRFRKCA
jgi:hypothetical protein